MSKGDIQSVLEKISEFAASGDHETAHSLRDELYRDVLRTVANGNRLARSIASEALKAEQIDFAEWCS